MKDVLIIKLGVLATQKVSDDLYNLIMLQKEKGVIVLPAWCDCELINVPDDLEIKIEEGLEEDGVKEPLSKSEN